MKSSKRNRLLSTLGAAGPLLAASGGVHAESVVVQPRSVEIVTEMSSDSDTVEVIKPGQQLQIVSKTPPWLKVLTPSGKTGYVPQSVLIRTKGESSDGMSIGSSSASPLSAGAAGRGLTDDAARYAHDHGYNTAGPDQMTAMRQKFKADLKAFKADGHVGAKK